MKRVRDEVHFVRDTGQFSESEADRRHSKGSKQARVLGEVQVPFWVRIASMSARDVSPVQRVVAPGIGAATAPVNVDRSLILSGPPHPSVEDEERCSYDTYGPSFSCRFGDDGMDRSRKGDKMQERTGTRTERKLSELLKGRKWKGHKIRSFGELEKAMCLDPYSDEMSSGCYNDLSNATKRDSIVEWGHEAVVWKVLASALMKRQRSKKGQRLGSYLRRKSISAGSRGSKASSSRSSRSYNRIRRKERKRKIEKHLAIGCSQLKVLQRWEEGTRILAAKWAAWLFKMVRKASCKNIALQMLLFSASCELLSRMSSSLQETKEFHASEEVLKLVDGILRCLETSKRCFSSLQAAMLKGKLSECRRFWNRAVAALSKAQQAKFDQSSPALVTEHATEPYDQWQSSSPAQQAALGLGGVEPFSKWQKNLLIRRGLVPGQERSRRKYGETSPNARSHEGKWLGSNVWTLLKYKCLLNWKETPMVGLPLEGQPNASPPHVAGTGSPAVGGNPLNFDEQGRSGSRDHSLLSKKQLADSCDHLGTASPDSTPGVSWGAGTVNESQTPAQKSLERPQEVPKYPQMSSHDVASHHWAPLDSSSGFGDDFLPAGRKEHLFKSNEVQGGKWNRSHEARRSDKLVQMESIEAMIKQAINEKQRSVEEETCDILAGKGIHSGGKAVGPGGALVSIICPLSGQRLQVPVRGASCTHRACFDLRTFLQKQLSRASAVKVGVSAGCQMEGWECPLCGGDATWQSIVVDGFLLQVVKLLVLDVLEIRLFPDATWQAQATSTPRKQFEGGLFAEAPTEQKPPCSRGPHPHPAEPTCTIVPAGSSDMPASQESPRECAANSPVPKGQVRFLTAESEPGESRSDMAFLGGPHLSACNTLTPEPLAPLNLVQGDAVEGMAVSTKTVPMKVPEIAAAGKSTGGSPRYQQNLQTTPVSLAMHAPLGPSGTAQIMRIRADRVKNWKAVRQLRASSSREAFPRAGLDFHSTFLREGTKGSLSTRSERSGASADGMNFMAPNAPSSKRHNTSLTFGMITSMKRQPSPADPQPMAPANKMASSASQGLSGSPLRSPKHISGYYEKEPAAPSNQEFTAVRGVHHQTGTLPSACLCSSEQIPHPRTTSAKQDYDYFSQEDIIMGLVDQSEINLQASQLTRRFGYKPYEKQ